MNRYWLRLVCLGLAVFIAAVLARFPAGLALDLLRGSIPPAVSWRLAEGTAFNATLHGLAVEVADHRYLLLETVKIQTSILPLLIGRMAMHIHARTPEGEITGKASLRPAGWTVPELQGYLPLQDLAGLAPELAGMGAAGLVVFSAKDVRGRYQQLPDTGSFHLAVENARLDLLYSGGELGSYSLEIRAGGAKPVEGELATLDNNALLHMAGAVNSSQDGTKLQFIGGAWVSPAAPEEVASILPLLGPIENNQARIAWAINL
jgi:hypothetical protein